MTNQPPTVSTPWRCKLFGHKMRNTRNRWNFSSSNRRARHTFGHDRKCLRCPYTDTVSWFDSRGYWADLDRERRIEEMAEAVRRGTRHA